MDEKPSKEERDAFANGGVMVGDVQMRELYDFEKVKVLIESRIKLMNAAENLLRDKRKAFYENFKERSVCVFCQAEDRRKHEDTCHFTIIEKLIEEIKGE